MFKDIAEPLHQPTSAYLHISCFQKSSVYCLGHQYSDFLFLKARCIPVGSEDLRITANPQPHTQLHTVRT